MILNYLYTRIWAVVGCGAVLVCGNVRGGEGSPADLMPERAFGYVELVGLEPVIGDIKGSRLMELVMENEKMVAFMGSEDWKKIEGGKAMAELMLGTDLWTAGGKLFGGELAAAVYPQAGSEQPAALVFIRPADVEFLEKPKAVVAALMEKIVELDAAGGVEVYAMKGEVKPSFRIAVGDGWMVMASNEGLLESYFELADGEEGARPLSGTANFGLMEKELGGGHLGKVFVNSEMISEFVGGRMGVPEKLDQPMVSLVVGGLLELFVQSPYAAIALDYEEGEIVVTAGVSGSPEDLDEAHRVFFGEEGDGASRIPDVGGKLGGFALHRDIVAWYAAREELLVEASLPGFDEFETGIGNLLPGKDFGEDVLPMLGENVRFVSAAQSYDYLKGAKPGVQLPGFAFVFDLEKPEEAADVFQLTFNGLMAIGNFQAAQEGRTPSVVEADIYKGVKYTSSRYMDQPEGDRLSVAYNFLPAVARVGDKYILSSSLELCKGLIDALQDPEGSAVTDGDTVLDVEMGPVVALLEANRSHLVANGIKKGQGAKEAKREVDAMLEGLGLMERVTLDAGRGESGGYRMRLGVRMR